MSRTALRSLTVLFLLAQPLPVGAQADSASVERFVAQQAEGAVIHIGPTARIEVEVGRLDPRLRLAPCNNVEPFLPAGVRLWGRAHVGLRCADRAASAVRWQVFMPVNVRVFGPAMVAARPIVAGQPIDRDDLALAEVEWTREPHGVLTDWAHLDGRVSSRPIALGQPVPLSALRAPQVLAAGDQVRVVGQGAGFVISGQAVALASAQEGQSVRVRLDSGRILTGTARAGRWVEISF